MVSGVILFDNPLEYLKKAQEIAVEKPLTIYGSLHIAQVFKYGKLVRGDEKQGRWWKGWILKFSTFKVLKHGIKLPLDDRRDS